MIQPGGRGTISDWVHDSEVTVSARAVSFRLPPILAIFAGLILAGLALASALALVVVSVLAGIAALVLGRLKRPWQRHEPGGADILTADYEIVRDTEPSRPLPESGDRR